MWEHNICKKYVKIVAEMIKNNIRIKTGNILIEAVPPTMGIQQRDSLNPILFNFVMNEIVKEVKDIEAEYNIGNNIIQIL